MLTKSHIRAIALLALTTAALRAQTEKTPATPTPATPETPATAGRKLGSSSWVVPVDVKNSANPSQADWWNLGWQTFIALNWPALPPTSTQVPGIPDTSKALGAKAGGAFIPTAWLTYAPSAALMLADAQDPGPWGAKAVVVPAGCGPVPAGSVAPGFGPMVLDAISKSAPHFSGFNGGINEASGNPIIDQAGHYLVFDIRLNQSEYTYIYQNQYYSGDVQKATFKNGGKGIKPFPRTGSEPSFSPPLPPLARFGALEVKASWRVLRPGKDNFSRYYTQTGYFLQPDGNTCEGPVTFGLVGLHILRLTPTTPSTWFWATFEQVDNTQPPDAGIAPTLAVKGSVDGKCMDKGYSYLPANVKNNVDWTFTNKPVNVCRVVAIPEGVQAANKFWQSQVQGTPWQYYQLVDTVNPPVKGGPSFTPADIFNSDAAPVTVNLPVLANASMETYSQGNNCVSCHGAASAQGAGQKPLTSDNQIFTFLLGDAYSATNSTDRVRSKLKFEAVK